MRRAALAGLLLAGALSGCATWDGGGEGFRGGAEARAALRGLQADYENLRSEYFFERFDTGEFPNFQDFRDRVKTFLLRTHGVTMRLIVDTVLQTGDEVSARVRWNRSFVDDNGMTRLEEGSCEFLLRRRESGGLAVRDIKGESPF